ncbi:metallophosphoesterase [Alcanivorax sp. JB21]|uniref:metallophosphoesterase family protein n=1 Tax=Alcanivorax limicola TaxID=2874102 RepID=UPI001CBEF37C|nr:metallophosphoesterase [Alcanivorax limicola]MBZ2188900.1 metallophosphoesterase [Alcanivorax limicola]
MNNVKLPGVAALLLTLGLTGCGGSSNSSNTPGTETPTVTPLRVGMLPDTQGDGPNVAVYAMDAVLKRQHDMGADVVIAVGDLTNNGTPEEFAQWLSVADKYREAGMEILPLMGNHEDSWAHTTRWIDAMRPYIPADAIHMPYAEFLNYSVVRSNVLIINIRYWGLAGAFPWIRDTVARHRDEVDHIIISSHDGLIGAKYGQVREQIVTGQKGENGLLDQYDEIRRLFVDNDVIWLQGHEHQYQRSVVRGPFTAVNKSLDTAMPVAETAATGPASRSWTETGGNYRLPYYTQIMTGNASYKGYELRWGESELVQRIILHKSNSMSNGSPAYDVNAGMLTFNGPRVDYQSWYAEHTVQNDLSGPGELADPAWTLFDRFSRTTDRCEKIVYPNSIPAGTRPVLDHDPTYRTAECRGPDGAIARLEAGTNNMFNRIESTTRTMGYTPDWSRAESTMDLLRLTYQYLYQYHQAWTPNLNGNQRAFPDGEQVRVPETTIDTKKHVTLSWMPAQPDTASSVLLVSGTGGQNGIYTNAWGGIKNIETDTGLPGSQPDGSAKAPHTLPSQASRDWDLQGATTDYYALSFSVPDTLAGTALTLGLLTDEGWQPAASADCIIEAAFHEAWLNGGAPRDPACDGETLVGFDASTGNVLWWMVADRDLEVALLPR